MAYLVLAAGAVMVILGALAIVTGYPIIQVERGWTTVIAGTSLLAGGIVTMALSLVLRALTDLRHALVVPRASLASYDEATGAPPAVEPRIESRIKPGDDEMTPHEDSRLPDVSSLVVPAMAAFAPHGSDEMRQGETHPSEAAAHAAEPHGEDAHPSVAENDPHPAEDRHEEPPPPHFDDWLDRAFADLPASPARAESIVAKRAAEPLMEHAPATQLHDDHLEPSVDVYAPHHHEQSHEAYAMEHAHADAAPAPEEPTSAVIGRYEADGTSYTMYADGSIEAQSDAGIYRFASMSELKAFIEG